MRPTAGGGLLLGGCNDGWKVHFTNSQTTPLPALMVTAAAPARVRVRPDDKMFHQLPPTTHSPPSTTHNQPPTTNHPQLTTRPLTITNQKPQTTNQPIMVDPKTQSVLCKVFKLIIMSSLISPKFPNSQACESCNLTISLASVS